MNTNKIAELAVEKFNNYVDAIDDNEEESAQESSNAFSRSVNSSIDTCEKIIGLILSNEKARGNFFKLALQWISFVGSDDYKFDDRNKASHEIAATMLRNYYIKGMPYGYGSFLKYMRNEHRTLQQNFTRLVFAYIEILGDDSFNELWLSDYTKQTSKELIENFINNKSEELIKGDYFFLVPDFRKNYNVYKASKWLSYI